MQPKNPNAMLDDDTHVKLCVGRCLLIVVHRRDESNANTCATAARRDDGAQFMRQSGATDLRCLVIET